MLSATTTLGHKKTHEYHVTEAPLIGRFDGRLSSMKSVAGSCSVLTLVTVSLFRFVGMVFKWNEN